MTTIGLQLPDFSWLVGADPASTMGRIRDAAQAGEAAGFGSLWVMDHLLQLPPLGGPPAPILEGYVMLGALAAVTTKAELGTLVTGVTYRNPAHLAKQIATLDTLSGGRIILGIGAAWFDVEHAAYGWDFPPVKERFARLDEAVTICRGMLDNETFSFAGEYYRVDDARVVPRPLRRVPLMIGGSGPKKTLRMVAERADMCNVSGTAEAVGPKLAILDEHCDAVGRPRHEVKRTNLCSLFICPDDGYRDAVRGMLGYDSNPDVRNAMIISTEGEATQRLGELAATGLDEIIVNLPLITDTDAIHRAADVMRAAIG
jgi:F420-dependent oxidoreductase-like protein